MQSTQNLDLAIGQVEYPIRREKGKRRHGSVNPGMKSASSKLPALDGDKIHMFKD